MIPGGSLGSHIREHAKMGVSTSGGNGWSFDGTDLIAKIAGTTVAKLKASGNLEIAGDILTNQSF